MVNKSQKRGIQYCSMCGKKIPKNSIYCEQCNLQLEKQKKEFSGYEDNKKLTCPFCQKKIESDSIFCSHCGKRITIIPLFIEEKRKSNFLINFFKWFFKYFSSEKMNELEKFKILIYSNKWEEALDCYEKLNTRIKNELMNYDIISIIKKNIKFPLLLFIDIESDPNNSEIWEIAAVKKRGDIDIGRFHTFIKSSSPIPGEKLSLEEYIIFQKAPNLQKAIESFNFFLGDQSLILVGHNIKFDIEHISKYFAKILEYSYMDTLELSYLCWPLQYSHTLSNLMNAEEIHRAEYDVDSNILLFNKIIKHIKSLEILEKSFLFQLLDNTTINFLKIFLGDIPTLDSSHSIEYIRKIEDSKTPDLAIEKNFSTKITFFDKISNRKNIFIDIDGHLSKEEFYKNILNMIDGKIYVLIPEDSLLTERRNISEITGENKPSKQITLFSEHLEKFCAYRFQKVLQSDLDIMHPDFKKILLYFMMWSLQTSDGILDPNLYFWMYNITPEIRPLIRKFIYHEELCSSECPLKIKKACPTLYSRTNQDIIFTDFPILLESQDNRVILNDAHKLDEFITNGLIETISQENIENLMCEFNDQVDFSSLKESLHEMKNRMSEFVEGRDPFRQKRYTKTLRILEFFKKSNDWETLHETKIRLINEISDMTEKIGENDKTIYEILSSKICLNLSYLLPHDYVETQYVTWISIDYDEEQNVKNWSVKRTLIDIKKIKETFIKKNKVILISNSCNLEKNRFLLESLNLGDKIPIIRIDGFKKNAEVIISGHLPRSTRFNLLSFLSYFGELIYGLSDITLPLEIITSSYLHSKLLSELLKNRDRLKIVSQPLFESQRKAFMYIKKLEKENVKNFIFINQYSTFKMKDMSSTFTLVESIPFPNFFDPVVSARSSRFIEASKDYERFIIPRIAFVMNDIISYGKANSDHVIITDSRFVTGYYAYTVNSLISSELVLCGEEDHFLIALKKLLPSEYHIDRQRLHQISDYLKRSLIKENITSEIDFSAIDPLIYLKSFFGYDTFKPKQAEVITHIFTNKDTFAVMPTGYGKSLCYQIPAIAYSILAEGLTIIISPLQALMRDQVQSLRGNGLIKATYINSSLSSIERIERLKGIQNGWYDIVYLSPEQLRNRRTREAIRSREILLFVIDEAHCLSQWGHDFRPDYFHIPEFIENLPQRPRIAAFTATATEQVIQDISTILKISSTPFTLPVKRDNLHLIVKKITANNTLNAEKKKYNEILEYLISNGQGKNGIVYCAYTRTTEELCQFLKDNSKIIGRAPHEIEYFHGKMNNQRKSDVQDNFMRISDKKSKISLIIATNAFGMGINKDDIHFIIHFDIPGSIEMYYQEIGRAGRDPSIIADCILLYWEGDLEKQRKLIKVVTEAELITVHDQLKQFVGSNESMIYISENDLADYTGIDPTTIRIAIYQLEKNGYVKRGVNAWKIITLRLSSIPTKLTEDQKKLLISLKLNESNWKTIQIDILASKLQWTIEKTENEIRGLLHCGPPILQEQKSIQVKILSRHTKTDLNIKYDLQKMLLTYLIKRSSSFEAGRWTSIYPKDWGLCGQALSKQLNLELNIDFPEIIQLWQKDYLVSIYEELLKISIKLNTGPEKIYCYFKNNKEIDLLVFQRLLNLCKETDIISFDPQEISEAIGISESELKNSLLRLNIFKIITTESVKSKGNCYTLNLLTPLSDSLSPNEIILKPKDLDLEDLRKLRLDRENKIKNIKKYAEIQDSFIERWKFLIDYFEGKMEIEQSEVFKEIVKGLNERQTDVVISPSKYLLVNAGAGTGKTETVARRLLFITDMRGIPSSRLLALTFSKSGVLQLRFRIRKIMPDRKVDIRTYHSLAFQILSEHAGKSPLWIKPGFRVRAISGLIHEFRSQIEGFNDNLKKEDKILKYQYAIEKLQSERTCIFPEDIKDTDVLKIEDCEVQGKFLKKLYAAYLNYLKSHNLIDFGFMLAQTVYLFNSQPNILTHYQKKLNYIIVDEYQDTTPVQDELLRLLSDWYGELTVVGDNDQNIFAWNFADVKNILDFEKTYPGSKVINLERNYRSTKRILEIANASINHNKLRIPKTLFPDRVSIGSFVKIKYTDSNDDIGIDYIVGRIREIQELNMCNLHEIAILTRSNKQQTTIIEALRDVNIPASSPKEEIELFNNIQIKEIIDMMEIISKEKPDITAYNCFTEALHALQKQNTFSKFVDAIKEFEDSSEDNSASAFVRYTRSVSKSDFRFGNEEAVNVLTIHKSKGLEFKVVFVTYLSKFKFPIFKSDIEEERRVFYVSLTRAENELHVIGSKEQKSIFIEEIEHLLQNADNINFQPKKLDEIPSELRYQL